MPGFYKELAKEREPGHDIDVPVVICHREPRCNIGYDYEVTRNVGLEWHMYHNYLMNYWDGGNTLYIHDDTVIESPDFWRFCENIRDDCTFIFHDHGEATVNAFAHGRAFVLSDNIQHWMAMAGGFWYDENNTGQTETGPYNAGIQRFLLMVRLWKRWKIKYTVTEHARFGVRGVVNKSESGVTE